MLTMHSFIPGDTRPIDALLNCILDIKMWTADNSLQFNQEKTEILVIDPEAHREELYSKLKSLSVSPPTR